MCLNATFISFLGLKEKAKEVGISAYEIKLFRLARIKTEGGEKTENYAIYTQDQWDMESRARKIFEFHLARWASNSQILLARGPSRLPKFSNSLIIHKPKNGSQQACFNVINPS